MIGRLTGVLVAKQPPQVVVDVSGVGYDVDVPMSTLYALPAIGERVMLLCHLVVREDAHLLFGFATEQERSTFRQLLKISGIGPKVALAILSGLSVEELGSAVRAQDSARLVRIPGIGKKTAERLLLELKGKDFAIASVNKLGTVQEVSANGDIMNALLALGYTEKEVTTVMRVIPENTGVSEGIRLALKALAR